MYHSSPAVAGQPPAPLLCYRGQDYWRVSDVEALLVALRARADLHEWSTAAKDKKSHKELTRFYHRAPGTRQRVEPAGLVIDREHGQVWLRLVGSDLPRVRRIVEALAGGQVAEEVQACLL